MPEPNHNGNSEDADAERLVYFVFGWLAAIALAPLHAFVIFSYFHTGSVFAFAMLSVFFALPLLLVDYWAFNWFKDNISVFRWIQRGNGTSR